MIRDWVRRHEWQTVGIGLLVAISFAGLVLLAPMVAAIASVVILPVGGWLFANVELAEKWIGRTVEVFSFASTHAERIGLSAEMQGTINGARNHLQEELPDIMPQPVRVKFVRNAEDFAGLRNGEIVISLQDHRRHGENTARATLGYVSTATIRPARPYVGADVMAGVDYSLTKRILRQADRAALDYFLNEIWSTAMKDREDLRVICAEVEQTERRGLLVRLLLTEYLELGRKLYGDFPTPQVHAEARELLKHIATIAGRAPEERVPLSFRRTRIRVAVILVGERHRAELEGVQPYIEACQWAIRRGGIDTIYLLGRGDRVGLLGQVANQMERNDRVLAVDVSEYVDERDDGKVPAACARISIDPSR